MLTRHSAPTRVRGSAPSLRPRRSMKKWIALFGWVALSLGAGLFGSQFTPGAWYEALDRPSWTPPNWLFGPVWTTLYVLMGVAAWRVWRRPEARGRGAALGAFLFQLVLNALWSWIFFGLQMPGAAALEIVVLLAAILMTTVLFWRIDRPSGALLVPYIVWVSYASALNVSIWLRN